ncbi:hypothetical protein [Lichenibacterium ramalinae]|uniref:hypothetical protein n=1 Tax=Lichenibacterium ramalinae TaxID=2316527 RepID=UPI0013EC11CB|nr:hypothetical protein [Lichenibacterium ramalinae]
MTVRGQLFLHEAGVRGHAFDDADTTRRFAVEMLVDGRVTDLARADAFAPEAAAIGDGCYGFGFALDDAVVEAGETLEVRLANGGERVGEALRLGSRPLGSRQTAPREAAGHVAWQGGLRLTGWVAIRPDAAATVRVIVDRAVAAEAPACGWVTVIQGGVRTTRAGFDIHLPEALADGRVYRATVVDGRGVPLAGSPCAVLAFPDGLRAFLMARSDIAAGDPRCGTIAALVPQSLPFAAFDRWSADHAPSPPSGPAASGPVAVVLVGAAVEPSIASLEAQHGIAWVALQAADGGFPGRFAPGEVATFLAAEGEDVPVVLALAGTRFRADALSRLAAAVTGCGGLVYPDSTVGHGPGRVPLLWPAYDAERQLEQGYAALVYAAPAAAVREALRAGAASLFDLFLALAARAAADGDAPVHLPEMLVVLPRLDPGLGPTLAAATRAATGAPATPLEPDAATGLPAVHVGRPRGSARVTLAVIQPEDATADLDRVAGRMGRGLDRCLLVSHGDLPVPRGWHNLAVPGWRNPARLRDAALRASGSAAVLLLDAGLEPVDDAALDELAGRLAAGGVAAVAGLVMDPDGIVLAAGSVAGPGFSIAPAFAGEREGAGGYAGGLRVARCCGALDAACLLVDRAAALEAGGFDAAHFPDLFAGADLSLRLRGAGHRLLVAPRARFVRHSVWREPPAPARQAEEAHLRRRWGEDLLHDPFYHPALNRDAAPFTALACPPLPRAARRPWRPAGPPLPPDSP